MIESISLRRSVRPWTLGDQLGLWRYNWIKRPWCNFMWAYVYWYFEPSVVEARKSGAFPLGRRWPKLGKMDRKDMEWALDTAREVAKDPPPIIRKT